MCILVIDFRAHELTLQSIREEYYHRKTLPLYRWPNGIMAGQDEEAGGTWLGVTPQGRWAALTNIPGLPKGSRSRGQLVVDFLTERWDVPPHLDQYSGFNLLLGHKGQIAYYSSHVPPRTLAHGRYALSNAPLGASLRAERALSHPQLEDLALQGIPGYGLRCATQLSIADTIIIEERTIPSQEHRRLEVQRIPPR